MTIYVTTEQDKDGTRRMVVQIEAGYDEPGANGGGARLYQVTAPHGRLQILGVGCQVLTDHAPFVAELWHFYFGA